MISDLLEENKTLRERLEEAESILKSIWNENDMNEISDYFDKWENYDED